MLNKFFNWLYGKEDERKENQNNNSFFTKEEGEAFRAIGAIPSHPSMLYRQDEPVLNKYVEEVSIFNDVTLYKVKETIQTHHHGMCNGFLKGYKHLTKEEYVKEFNCEPVIEYSCENTYDMNWH